MNTVGTVNLKISLPNVTCMQTFIVFDTGGYRNVLLGRDFMKKFGSAKFDFEKNRVQLGDK